MPELINPHDRFFKEALSRQEVAVDFLRHYLPPEVTALLDLSSLQLSKDSFVDEALQEHFSDLLYAVRLLGAGGVYIYVLFEHKSYADPLVALQLLRYMVRVWDYALRQEARLWPIVPVVMYHGAARWPIPLDFQSLFEAPEALRAYLPAFRYWLCDLSAYSDEELKGEVGLRAALLLLKHVLRVDLHDRLPEMAQLWYDLSRQKTGLAYVEAMLRYLVGATDRITERDLREVVEAVIPEGGALMMTIAQQWLERGLQQGLQQGEQRGEQRGQRAGLRQGLLAGIRLGLKLKFGAEGVALLPEIYRIEDVALLQALQDALETVSSPPELRRLYQGTN
jgi:predicted transposase/invertase (TIGR01784 family)